MKNLSHQKQIPLQLFIFLILFSLASSSLPVMAQTEPEKTRALVQEEVSVNEKRLALVIGNSDYQNTGKLPNAANDATDIAAALRDLGFEVIVRVNQDKRGMEKSISDFGERLKQVGVGVVFYAGHGVQYNGRNYLVPVDAVIPAADEVKWQAIDVNQVLDKFDNAKNGLNFLILDACRNNPFAREWSEFRDASQDVGLAKINAPKGTVLFYATEPGKVASDGKGRNGLFTEMLLGEIKKPNVDFDGLFKAVSQKVIAKSSNKQIPYREAAYVRDFYFGGTTEMPTPSRQAPVVGEMKETHVKEKDAAAREQEFWDAVKDSSDARKLRLYLEEFPKGANAAKAKLKLLDLEGERNVKTTTAPATVAAIEEEPPPATVKPKPEKPKVEKPKSATAPVVGKTRGSKSQQTSKNEVRTNSIGMELVSIPAGTFLMGLDETNTQRTITLARKDYRDFEPETLAVEKPARKVTLVDGFWIGTTEVTQAQWKMVMGENPSFAATCGDDCPVERVSWEMAKSFIKKLNESDTEFEYRLPSEAEWEYAARAGTTGLFAANVSADEMMWHSGNSEGKTHQVGLLRANAFGLFDVYGNVEEWCEDIFSPTYEGLPVDGSSNTTIGNSKLRIIRGGSWNNFPTYSRSSARKGHSADGISVSVGFRVAARLK